MKRPHGFDPPAQAPPAPRAKKKSSNAAAARQATEHQATEPQATERQAGRPATAQSPDPARPPAPVVPLHDGARRPEEARGRTARPRDNAERQAGREASAARRNVRAATRDRRRYEREEVRRFTLRSRRRRTIVTICLGAVALVVAFVLIGAFSPLMALRTIDVHGADRISEDDIVQALDSQLGRPLTLIDHAEVGKVLGTFPLIRSYSTEANPPHTLVIRIVERTPVAVVKTPEGFQLVDQAKVVIEESAKRPKGYPLITTVSDDADDTGFAAAIAVIDSLPGDLRNTVDTVTAGTRDDVTLTLAGGARVVWGSAEDSELKSLVLAQLMKNNAPDSIQEFDVSSPESAVVR